MASYENMYYNDVFNNAIIFIKIVFHIVQKFHQLTRIEME